MSTKKKKKNTSDSVHMNIHMIQSQNGSTLLEHAKSKKGSAKRRAPEFGQGGNFPSLFLLSLPLFSFFHLSRRSECCPCWQYWPLFILTALAAENTLHRVILSGGISFAYYEYLTRHVLGEHSFVHVLTTSTHTQNLMAGLRVGGVL